MLEHKDKVVQEVAACTCDRCQRRMTPDDLDWDEKLSIAYQAGYGSIFGDGCPVAIDLCQQCVKETLGPWLRITRSWLSLAGEDEDIEATTAAELVTVREALQRVPKIPPEEGEQFKTDIRRLSDDA